MEISAPAPRQLDWRTATLVAGGVAALELVLLLIIGIAMLSKPLAAHAKQSAEMRALGIDNVPPARPEPKSATLTRGKTSVARPERERDRRSCRRRSVAASRARLPDPGNRERRLGATAEPSSCTARAASRRASASPPTSASASSGPLDGIVPRQLHGAQLVVVLGT